MTKKYLEAAAEKKFDSALVFKIKQLLETESLSTIFLHI